MNAEMIPFDTGDALMDWHGLVHAFQEGHARPKAKIEDLFLYRGTDTLLSRSAWIDGMGSLTKTATVFPGNPSAGKSMIGGGVMLFDDTDGALAAVIDFHLITKWKTAGDSLAGALMLAPPGGRQTILIVGAGTVGENLIQAFSAGYPDAEFTLWSRTTANAESLVAKVGKGTVVPDLETAVRAADIILTATMTTEPIIKGAWLRPGQHLNMIGAYRPDMREADDEALLKSRVYVDSFDTTLGHIGELKIPLETGAIARDHVLADFYTPDAFTPTGDDITVFKNGGGAHLDLMTAKFVLDRWRG